MDSWLIAELQLHCVTQQGLQAPASASATLVSIESNGLRQSGVTESSKLLQGRHRPIQVSSVSHVSLLRYALPRCSALPAH